MAEGGKISDEAVFETLKELNVPVTKNELKCPTKEFIIRVFDCFLKDLQIDICCPELRTWKATNHIEDGDIYEECQALLLTAMTVNYITSPSGMNITVKDIIDPKPKRTKKILCNIMTFWKHFIMKSARFHAVEQTFEGEKKRIEDLLFENESLDEKYNEKCKILKNMQPSKAELLDAIKAKQEKSEAYEKQKENLLADYTALKTDITGIENRIRETEVNIITAQGTLDELGQLILSSPERVNTEIQRLKDKIKAEDIKIKEKEAKVKDTEKKLKSQMESLKGYEEALSKFKNIREDIEQLSGITKSIAAKQLEIDSEEDKVRKLQIELQQKEESKAQQTQKIYKLALNTKLQQETLTTLLQTHKSDEAKEKKSLELLKVETNELQQHIDSVSEHIMELKKRSNEANAKTKARLAEHASKMEEAKNSFLSDCEMIVEVVKKKFPDVSK